MAVPLPLIYARSSGVRPVMYTTAPASMSPRAIPFPTPRLAPVTSATRPFKFGMLMIPLRDSKVRGDIGKVQPLKRQFETHCPEPRRDLGTSVLHTFGSPGWGRMWGRAWPRTFGSSGAATMWAARGHEHSVPLEPGAGAARDGRPYRVECGAR